MGKHAGEDAVKNSTECTQKLCTLEIKNTANS